MEKDDDFQAAFAVKNLRRLRSDIRDLNKRLSRMEENLRTVGWLKIYMEYLPGLTAEKMLPYLRELKAAMDTRPPPLMPPVYQKYQPTRKDNWSWKEHILYTLFQEDRPLMTVELVEIHFQLGVKGKRDERLVRKDIAKNLTDLVKDGRIVKYKPEGHSKFFYCLPKWVEKNGSLKEEFLGKSPFL